MRAAVETTASVIIGSYVVSLATLYHSSLANVVAHEVAHSWMGNLVSPVTWVRAILDTRGSSRNSDRI